MNAEEKLAVTLRYLAACEICPSLMHQYRIHSIIIKKIYATCFDIVSSLEMKVLQSSVDITVATVKKWRCSNVVSK